MVLPLLFLLLLGQSDSMPPGYSIGIKITLVTNERSSDASEAIFYLQPDRSRTELRHKDGSEMKESVASVVRCDLRESLFFSPGALTYDARPYPPPRITEAQARAFGLRTTPNYRTVEPTDRIETNYQDTGERKEFFGFTARHLIITIRQTPLETGHGWPQTEILDGWYISVPLTSCERRHAIETKDDPVIYPNWTIENIEKVTTGDIPDPTEGWLPAEEKELTRKTILLSDGSTKEVLSGNEHHITKIEEVPMDPELFGPPAFYGKVPVETR
jgi:hypothetical protein